MSHCDQLYPSIDTVITSHGPWAAGHYPKRIQMFKTDTLAAGDIVLLGDSHTERGGDWSGHLGIPHIKNRGISGDNTDGVMARINEIICAQPAVVILMIGTNDLFTAYDAQKIASNIDLIGNTLAGQLPDARIIVQTVMPLAEGHEMTVKLSAINMKLRAMVSANYQLLDTNLLLSDAKGALPPTFTQDGVHLNKFGYRQWFDILRDALREE